uniref:DM2 domain-containing protein n=1 Tax=Romanomermis culicivorax TaxID=13658 RepID=A0A915KK61_ROMCU
MLEERFQIDLTEQKKQIDDTLMSLISAGAHAASDDEDRNEDIGHDADDGNDSGEDDRNGNALHEPSASNAKRNREETNGHGSAKKRPKTENNSTAQSDSSEDEISDEALARKLQQEELGFRRRTRENKGSDKKLKKAPNSSGPRNSVYTRECVLSEDLAAIVGKNRPQATYIMKKCLKMLTNIKVKDPWLQFTSPIWRSTRYYLLCFVCMARKDVVSRMWQIFKERNLLDHTNRQYVICDEQLERVFKAKKFKAFGMMKILKNHMKDPTLIVDEKTSS